MSTALHTAEQTAALLPYPTLAASIAQLLMDNSVRVPARLVERLATGASLFVMPAHDAQWAITKLITFVQANGARGLPAIQGDIVVFDARTGQRLALLDGPTVTARRTAAVSLLAAQRLAPNPNGPMLVVGAGVQGLAHVEAFHAGLGIREIVVASRSLASAEALVQRARALGLRARRVDDPNSALTDCPLVVSATPANGVVLHGPLRPDAFVAAVGAFTPQMVEWSARVCQDVAQQGTVVVDTRDADHEAGDLLQAGLDVPSFPCLADVIRQAPRWSSHAPSHGPVLFKSCGWAGWDLAAVRCAMAR